MSASPANPPTLAAKSLGLLALVNDVPAPEEVVGGEQIRPYEFVRWLEARGIESTVWCLRATRRRNEIRGTVRIRSLGAFAPGLIREVFLIPVVGLVIVCAALRARTLGHELVLWARVPAGVTWKWGLPILGDPSFLYFGLARRLGVHVWATNHDISPEHEADKNAQQRDVGVRNTAAFRNAVRSGRAQSLIQNFGLPRASVVTAVSDGTRAELVRRYRLRPETTGIVRAGVDPSAYAGLAPWSPPDGPWRIAYLGGAADADASLLLTTLRAIGANESVSVTLMGRGFDRFDRTLLPEGLDVAIRSDVRYEDLPSVAADVDVWLVPLGTTGYHAWAWPLKVPMYLASGRPVVITDHPEVTAAGVSPYVYATVPSEADGLARGLRDVFRDPDEACRRADAGRRFALTELTWDRQFEEGLRLLAKAGSAE